ncbi:MAG: hypothetical protein JO115_02915 [Pseudonocardiales bacterium]|nr:hypothetical protein [Pseudonocardiales bacterium]
MALDHGEVVELDGGTLVLGGAESPSVVLRLAPWRARSVARVLEEWSAVSRVFHRAPRPVLNELELPRTLDLATSVLGEPEPVMSMWRGGQTVPSRQRLDAVAVLAERETRLSALQRLALVDAAASWLSEPNGEDQLAYALLGAACTTEVTAEKAGPDAPHQHDQTATRLGGLRTFRSRDHRAFAVRGSRWAGRPQRGPDRRASAAAEGRP